MFIAAGKAIGKGAGGRARFGGHRRAGAHPRRHRQPFRAHIPHVTYACTHARTHPLPRAELVRSDPDFGWACEQLRRLLPDVMGGADFFEKDTPFLFTDLHDVVRACACAKAKGVTPAVLGCTDVPAVGGAHLMQGCVFPSVPLALPISSPPQLTSVNATGKPPPPGFDDARLVAVINRLATKEFGPLVAPVLEDEHGHTVGGRAGGGRGWRGRAHACARVLKRVRTRTHPGRC